MSTYSHEVPTIEYPSVEAAHQYFEQKQREFEPKEPQPGRAIFICPIYDAAEFIVPTVDRLAQQILQSQLESADILLMINGDGGDTYKALPALAELGLPTFYLGHAHPIPDIQNRINLLIADQIGERGKIHALQKAYRMLYQAPEYHPEWSFLIDSETRLFGQNGSSVIDHLLDSAASIDGLVSAEQQIVHFVDGQPVLDTEVPHPFIKYINYRARNPNTHFLYGGMIVGKTRTLIPLSDTAIMLADGNPSDDQMTTILARAFELPFMTDHAVRYTNRTPVDVEATERQILRWCMAPMALERSLGPEFVTSRSVIERAKEIVQFEFTSLESILEFIRLYAGQWFSIKRILKKGDRYELTAGWSHQTQQTQLDRLH